MKTLNTKETKQQNRVIIHINVCKIKELLVHFLCTVCVLSQLPIVFLFSLRLKLCISYASRCLLRLKL